MSEATGAVVTVGIAFEITVMAAAPEFAVPAAFETLTQ